MFPIGDFDQRITLQKQGAGVNELNERTLNWSEAFKAWARVRPVSQRDLVAADQPHALGSYMFTIRASKTTAQADWAAMRVQWQGGAYYVSGEPLKLDNGQYLQVRAISQKINDV